jgi:retrograde regulation protein 2
MGRSNGIRFSITSLAPPRARLLTPVYSTRASISLFDALTPTENGDLVFTGETISAVSSTLSHFIGIAELHHVPRSNTMVFATEAMRRASNAAEMLEAIANATGGLGVHVLEPSVETLFGAVMGSRSGLTNVDGGALFLDLGGGSMQMTWVDTSLDEYEIKAAMAGNSMPYGAAKLTRILEGGDASLRAADLGDLHASMQRAFDNLCSVFPKLCDIRDAHNKGEDASVDVYMCGGGFRGYGSMLMHNDAIKPYPISSIGTYTVDGASFKQIDEMILLNKSHNGRIFGMSKRRRSQFDAIATVIKAFISTVPNIRRVTFCKGSNRDGALMMKLPREIRESNPLEVLSCVANEKRPILFSMVLHKLSQALPREVDRRTTPTIFSDGLGYLFVRDIWSRGGFEADTNVSFALHNAISRDSDAPGLTHLARAVLGITTAARWGFNVSPADEKLAEGLEGILARHSEDAVFWARYIGAVASVITRLFPTFPDEVGGFDGSIRYEFYAFASSRHSFEYVPSS